MTLLLNHAQRLNLVVLLENFQWRGRREIWRACKVQEIIDLTESEKKTIAYGRGEANGGEYYFWDQAKADATIPPQEFTFTDDEMASIMRVLDAAPLSLKWFRSLQAQLPEPAESNGAAAAAETRPAMLAASRNEV